MNLNFCKISLIGSGALTLVLGGFFLRVMDPWHITAPKDQELLTVFQEKRSAFEKIRQMMTEDSTSYVSGSESAPQLDHERMHEYKSLMSEIYRGIYVVKDRETVRFIFSGGGLWAISPGWLKGIEYFPGNINDEGDLVQSLDRQESSRVDGVCLYPIAPKWFLVFQQID